ncbi:hypothetical protein D3C80_1580700 [compost metagenome]
MAVIVIIPHKGISQHLGKQIGMHIGTLLGDRHFLGNVQRCQYIANPDTRREYLREGADVNYLSFCIQRLDVRKLFTGETYFSVGVIFEDQNIVADC